MREDKALGRERKRQKFFEEWKKIRAKGVIKFGLKVTTIFSLSVFVPVAVIEILVDGTTPSGKRLFVRWISTVVAGVILTAISWWTNEGKYKNILIDNRIRTREIR